MSEIALEQDALPSPSDNGEVTTDLVQSGQGQEEIGGANLPAE